MKPTPAPAIIDGVVWEVRDSGDSRTAFVDFETNTMVVPMDNSPVGDMLRAHETAHVAITPRDIPELAKLSEELSNRTLQAAEDCRVYCSLQLAGIDTSASHWTKEDLDKIAHYPPTPEFREEKARALLATKGTGDYEKLSTVIEPELVDLVERIYAEHYEPDMSKGKLPGFDATVAASRMLREEIYEVPPPPPSGGDGEAGEGKDGDKSEENDSEEEGNENEGSGKPEAGKLSAKPVSPPKERKGGEKNLARPFVPGDTANEAPAPKVDESFISEEERNDLRELLGRDSRYNTGKPVADEKVKIDYPPLRMVHKGKRGFGNRRTATDSGSVPRRLNRYAVDSAVFSKTVKRGFGTVLIDVSGSMRLDATEIDAIIEKLPNSTIACYSGDGYSGHITILAKGGKRIREFSDCKFFHSYKKDGREYGRFPGGNVVDLQAVKWLAKQRGPRAWICDGVITGAGDYELEVRFCLKVLRIAKSARILRYVCVEDLLTGNPANKLPATEALD